MNGLILDCLIMSFIEKTKKLIIWLDANKN